MRSYFWHLGSVILIKIAIVSVMAHYLFPKDARIKVDTNMIQHKLMD